MRDMDLTSQDIQRLGKVTELMSREWAPCRYNCPVHADVRGYVELIARGQWRAAVDLIRESLPFAAICGRICHHPCEANCRRKDVDEPLAIRELKRFVAELQGAGGSSVRKADHQDRARVAIVGAGPSGMSAALDLARLGYRPTVFEKSPVAGGIPATTIPRYRLPDEVIRQDIEWICAHGVELTTGVEIGKDRRLQDLRGEGFSAILIATGLPRSRPLPMPGSDHPRVLMAMEFLTGARFERPAEVGGDVLVVGGGNVAMDVARTVLRLGARRVRAMCLEDEQEMPAWEWEQREAREEGVTFIHRRGPVEVLRDASGITGLRARKVTRVFDDARRFAPQYDDSDVIEIPCDMVVIAIGQMPDVGFAAGSRLAVSPRGLVEYNPATHQTNLPDVFACGEIVTAPGSAVEACAHGQRAAKAVHLYLSGRSIEMDDSLPAAIAEIPSPTAEKVLKTVRATVPTEPPEARRASFAEVDHNLAAEDACREARRCMSCGAGAEVLVDKCTACLTCLRVCPFDIPAVTDVARIDSALCQACGMCIADCPGNAIIARGYDVGELVHSTADALRDMPAPRIVAYVCGHHAPPGAWSGGLEEAIPHVVEFYLPSMSRLSAAEVLHAFDSGADGVLVVACRIGADRYPGATERVRKRVSQARDLLGEVGIAPERLVLIENASEGRSAMRQAMAEAARSIAAAPGESP